MRVALSKDRQESAISQDKPEMALLPGLCCLAGGGEASWADHIAAAWQLFYAAADIMDSLQDQDAPASWWADLGPAAALSASTGLFFSAASLLDQARALQAPGGTAPDLTRDFYSCFMTMSSGQYQDLRQSEPSIERYWEIASAKSGAFFSLACRSGARLAVGDDPRIENYGQFGRHLGLLMQILDDLEDLQFLTQPTAPIHMGALTHSLPVIYTLQMVPPGAQEKLQACLRNAAGDPGSAKDAAQIIEGSGAVIYLLSEIERHKSLAADHLIKAKAQSPAREALQGYLERLVSFP
jgi:geranylgeranyl pyrophosphate synthase